MRPSGAAVVVVGILSAVWPSSASQNSSRAGLQTSFSLLDDRPDGCPKCPSCFNCNTPSDQCLQYSVCNGFNGKCDCPAGFGGDNCAEPLCGSLAQGKNRPARGRDQKSCECEGGWEGINCNVCKTNDACSRMMPTREEESGAICYKQSTVVEENYQMCDVTNKGIRDMLKEQKPQVTFSCNAAAETCTFQFWVDQVESFYCGLDSCSWVTENAADHNFTKYTCETLRCACIPDRMLCGAPDSIDLSEFLEVEIKGPATFSSLATEGGSPEDSSRFQEPGMDDLIKTIFGDESIELTCNAGECLYRSQVPGYVRPDVPKINTPLIAGVIAGSALFIVAAVLTIWWLSRRSTSSHGPIYLEDDEEENAKLMADHKPATLQFENVSYHLQGKQILSGIMGTAQPGQLMAIMGASGAGKTSLLDILGRKNKRGVVEGDFYVNGEKVIDAEYRTEVGFVDQEDTMLPTLTVHETILTSALLRLPRDMKASLKEQKVSEVEKQLGIYHIRDQFIGSEEGSGRGISGGEKRRVSIACELVTSPRILFLDEPTSGLDAFNAFNVIECLVTLAKTYNRTVIFTIHQPRSNIVALFDQLILLAKGRVVYSGTYQSCQRYFDQLGYTCPPGFNIADYLVDLTMHAASSLTVSDENTSHAFDISGDGVRTTSSSTRAIKSIASASNVSIDNSSCGSQTEPLLRPKHKRRHSLKQQQDRKLYTRKKSSVGMDSTPPTPQTDDEGLDTGIRDEASQQWLKLQKQQGRVPPLILDDPHQLPPPASGIGSDLDMLILNYASSDVAGSLHDDIQAAVQTAVSANGPANGMPNGAAKPGSMKGYKRVGRFRQFIILSVRTWRNLYRNPMLMLTHYAVAILLAVMLGYFFYGLTDNLSGFQDRLGLLFFILAMFGFSTLTSLTVFSSERLIFIRERANGYYSTSTYFAAKVLFDIVPLRLIPPIIVGVVVYPMTGLVPQWPNFLKFMLILILFNLAAAAVCLCIGILFKDIGVANMIGSLVMLFSLLFAGFLLSHDTIPLGAMWLQSLSIFHYGFEALIVNEVRRLVLIEHKYGIDIEVPGASILSAFGFDVFAYWPDVLGLGIFSVVWIIVAYMSMRLLLVEKR